MAIKLGSYVIKFKWFGVFYILYTFVLFPLICWGLSYLFQINIFGLIIGIILINIFMSLSIFIFNNFESIGNKIEKIIRKNKEITVEDINLREI